MQIFNFLVSGFVFFSALATHAALDVYGPGGPAPAMIACGSAFEKEHKIKVNIHAGPLEKWIEKAGTADLFYSGSENMMDGFAEKLSVLDVKTIQTHYLRPSAILVRPKNPKNIQGVKDLLNQPLRIMVVNGAGQVGMWEDIVGRLKSAEALNQFRSRIVYAEKNTGDAEKKWKADPSIDAWLVFNIWGTRNPQNAVIVATEPELTIYRSMGTAVSKNTKQQAKVQQFIEFIKSPVCRKLFEKEGWF
ncbi:substrate-binding domain-containing protein [Bdellovibrio sp. 22V]|uniref:substrate-binding domain-containing protein n=1 Tax=Bdellovibrio sp. 22V TaxID=3044166 RepID=UPI002542B30A|nr:substrate-binding domain-containing protein [Bdellovibrio sp. 22V]WII72129.1 substrate-binding domain-containing protein [Bdellovibrio sp. 22V]